MEFPEAGTSPILRIEVEQHTASITSLDADDAGRYLVTGSVDKTARVWALRENKLLKVLRLPIGPGDEGKVYAVAISPDGGTVAVGGWTSESGADEAVYLFDRASGQVLRRLGGLESVVGRLVFSWGGEYLAAGLWGGNGARVWRVADWETVLADRNYGGQVCGMAFDRQGRLATTSSDGLVRLYDTTFELVAGRLLAEATPCGIAFSPDGEHVAVGYGSYNEEYYLRKEEGRITVVSARPFEPIAQFIQNFAFPGDLHFWNTNVVTWSANGRHFYACATVSSGPSDQLKNAVLCWPLGDDRHFPLAYDKRLKEPRILSASVEAISDLKAYGSAGAVFAAADPRFGAFDGDRRKVLDRGPAAATNTATSVSWDGYLVCLALGGGGDQQLWFDLNRRLITTDGPDVKLFPPRIEAAEFTVTDWRSCAPRLERKPQLWRRLSNVIKRDLDEKPRVKLLLDECEVSCSLAIAPDETCFVLGTSRQIRLFDSAGVRMRSKRVPHVVRAVNITGDGRLVVAALGDGTMRWHRVSDLAELLVLFVHCDRKRWIVWTPEGYFDAGPGGDELLGWHVNRGRDQAADFFPLSHSRDRLYRPDVIAKVLEALDGTEALRLANAATARPSKPIPDGAMLPPVVEIKSPADGAEIRESQVTLTYLVRSLSGAKVTSVTALIDGRPTETKLPQTLRASEEGEIGQITVNVPPQSTAISLIARAGEGASEPATIRTRWRGEKDCYKRALYVLTVGVSHYKAYSNLKFADRDALDFAEAISGQRGILYREVKMKSLANEQASREAVLSSLDWIRRETTDRDVAMVLISGHGLSDSHRRYHFLPYDVDPTQLFATSVRQSDLAELLSSIPGKVLFFLDTCHAGSATGGKGGEQADIDGLVNELKSAENGVVVFASWTGKQISVEREEWQNGAFTEALLEGLSGRADRDRNGKIMVTGLEFYLSQRVKELTEGRQSPTTTKPKAIEDFPIAVVRQIA